MNKTQLENFLYDCKAIRKYLPRLWAFYKKQKINPGLVEELSIKSNHISEYLPQKDI